MTAKISTCYGLSAIQSPVFLCGRGKDGEGNSVQNPIPWGDVLFNLANEGIQIRVGQSTLGAMHGLQVTGDFAAVGAEPMEGTRQFSVRVAQPRRFLFHLV